MNIFRNYREAVRFAFALARHPGNTGASRNSMIRVALNDVGVNTVDALLDAPTLEMLGGFALQVGQLVDNLPSAMRAALVAHESQDWDHRRTAATWLQNHFRPQLAHVIDHPALADRMVTRHYIAERERGPGWTLEAIGVEFRVSVARLGSAVRVLELVDDALIEDAITLLAHSLPLPTLEASDAH